MISRIALAASLALAVAACGSNKEPSDESTGAAAAPSEAASAAPAAVASAAAPSDTPSVSPSATPTAKATEEHKDDDKDKGKDKDSDDHADQPAGPPQAFNQCAACHSTTPGKTIIGPSLAHVYGRKAGSLAGFQYSDAMKGSGLTWTSSNLDAFLTNPAGKVPGTLMGLAGIKDAAQRKAIIAYLKTL
ncbi:MAG: c-type cytochrome [Croceibacterium sp.]